VILKIMNYLPNFSKLRTYSSFIFILLCLWCFGQPVYGPGAGRGSVREWAAIDPGRVADWASQLPVGEAKREGIIGSAIV
jgi:hypothetical protein